MESPILRLPYTITASGTYVLDSNLSDAGTGHVLIRISANNVTLDFQGHYIAGPAGSNPGQQTYGV